MDDPISVPLKIITSGGYNFKYKSFFYDFWLFTNVLSCLYVEVMAGVKIIMSFGDLSAFYSVGATVTMFLAYSRGFKFWYHRSTLHSIIEQNDHFWSPENYSAEIQETCEKIRKRTAIAIKAQLVFCALTMGQFGFDTSSCYNPEGQQYILLFFYIQSCFFAYCSVMGLDTFFCGLCANVIVQFKLLNEEVRQLTSELANKRPEDFRKQLKKCVDYHNLLLDYCTKVNNLWSETYVILVFAIIFLGCVELYTALNEGFTWSDKLRSGLYFMCIITGFACYCIPGQIITNSSLSLGDVFYETSWYDFKENSFKKCFIVPIARSQRPFVFVGCGIITLNLGTFITVLKTSFTYYTYLKTMTNVS